jgi:hypothetical protein
MQNPLSTETFRKNIFSFVQSCSTGRMGEYRMYPSGNVTLYASCFAAMTLHYLNLLDNFTQAEQLEWANYINEWQDETTGSFVGPEIVDSELLNPRYDWSHVTSHLTAHVLPALQLLGSKPKYPLKFAHNFLDKEFLEAWLKKIDWHNAWTEGNNLLFVVKFLLYLRDFEGCEKADQALDYYFSWLDEWIDPNTGIWGTNGYCNLRYAIFGGYHQLLVYYYCNRKLLYPERLIDSTLTIQHPDGGFAKHGGGGACEDVDAVDILVNVYKLTGYRFKAIKSSLSRALQAILNQQFPDGGFVYRVDTDFIHNGIKKTFVPSNHSHLFATWFRVHTIALICQIIDDHPLSEIPWEFNKSCSMGWHRKSSLPVPRTTLMVDRIPEFIKNRSIYHKFTHFLERIDIHPF